MPKIGARKGKRVPIQIDMVFHRSISEARRANRADMGLIEDVRIDNYVPRDRPTPGQIAAALRTRREVVVEVNHDYEEPEEVIVEVEEEAPVRVSPKRKVKMPPKKKIVMPKKKRR